MKKLPKGRNVGTFELPNGKTYTGILEKAGRSSYLQINSPEDLQSMALRDRCVVGELSEHLTKVSLHQCITLSNGSLHSGADATHRLRLFPHSIIYGDCHLRPEDEVVKAISFALSDAHVLFDDRRAFGTVFSAGKYLSTILNEEKTAADRPIPIGEDPKILYFSGQHEIAQASTVLGRVSVKRYDNMFPVIDPFSGSGGFITENLGRQLLPLDASKIGSRRAYAAGRGVAELISSNVELLSGPGTTQIKTNGYKFAYASPDAIVLGKVGAAPFVDGFSYRRLPSTASNAAVTKFISEIAFAATFFRRYWIIADGRRDEAEAIVRCLNELEIKSVGMALVDTGEQDRLSLVQTPSALPTPDRTSAFIKASSTRNNWPIVSLREAAKLY